MDLSVQHPQWSVLLHMATIHHLNYTSIHKGLPVIRLKQSTQLKLHLFNILNMTKTKHVSICSALHIHCNLQMRLCCTYLSDWTAELTAPPWIFAD